MLTVNEPLLKQLIPENTVVSVAKIEEAGLDEMWSFVAKKQNQRWLWHAIDHNSGNVLAYVLAPHEDDAFLKLQCLLQPFGIIIGIPMGGALMIDILIRISIMLENETHKRLSANILL